MNKLIKSTYLLLCLITLQLSHAKAQSSDGPSATIWISSTSNPTDWFNPINWSDGVPDQTKDVIIRVTSNGAYPLIERFDADVNSITIESNASMTINNVVFSIYGEAISNGNFNATVGTVRFAGRRNQVIPEHFFYLDKVWNLIIDNHVEMHGSDTLTGRLTIGSGHTFITNDSLVLKSTAQTTASIGPLKTSRSGQLQSYLVGKVTVQRYINARKAWRLLSVPLQETEAPSINDALQSGATWSSRTPNGTNSALNPKPGYGIHVTGGRTSSGFDPSPTNNASMKFYDNASNSFKSISSDEGTYAPLTSKKAYMIYSRGDRSINLMDGVNAGITSTTLEMTGFPKMGFDTTVVPSTNFTLFANPFPSAIDFSKLTRSNVKNSFYVWDPALTGSFGLGAYVAVSFNPSTGMYDHTGAISLVSEHIPSGTAVFVESEDGVNEGEIIVKEEDKTNDGHDQWFRVPTANGQSIRLNLYGYQAAGNTSLIDGALLTFSELTSNGIDKYDVKKMYSGYETVSLYTAGKALAIERRKSVENSDTSFIQMNRLRRMNYKMDVVVSNMETDGVIAIFKDNFDASNNERVLQMNGTNVINFNVTNDPRSYAADRFSIVYARPRVTLAPRFETIKTTQNEEIIPVANQKPEAVVFPNPVTGNDIQVKMKNVKTGVYEAKIYSLTGQLLLNKRIQYNETDGSIQLKATRAMISGKYDLKIVGEGVNIHLPIIKQ